MATIIASDIGTLLLAANEDAVLLPGVVASSIRGDDNDHFVDIMGTVASATSLGVWLGDVGDEADNAVLIRATGAVYGSWGVFINGRNGNVINHGSVHGETSGVALNSTTPGLGVIRNFGEITGGRQAVEYYGGNLQDTLLENFGTVAGLGPSAYALQNTGSSRDTIHNRGSMHGDILTGTLDDWVINTGGLIMGDVDLGDGQDRFDNRGGAVVGTVMGGAGHDTFLPGAGEEVFVGGTGVDTLDFRMTSGVTVALDGSRDNTGVAQGDTYADFDNLIGSTVGADVLIGNTFNNRIVGAGGNDVMQAGSGNDSLEGGHGIDTLTGGTGNDAFVFRTLREVGDLITDFSANAAGNNDAIWLSALGMGGGLAPGALLASRFQVRADNVAQDSNDRAIFRTTDRTVWWDADGAGGSGAILVADLQATATLSAADIIMI